MKEQLQDLMSRLIKRRHEPEVLSEVCLLRHSPDRRKYSVKIETIRITVINYGSRAQDGSVLAACLALAHGLGTSEFVVKWEDGKPFFSYDNWETFDHWRRTS